jgi:transcriptional regulator with XRE-family HTH domain
MKNFVEWLLVELNKREWQPATLARKANLNTGTLSHILNETRKPGPEVCRAIAVALEEPPETVFRIAGLLPPLPGPEDDLILRELSEVVKRLTPPNRAEVLTYALYRFNLQEERKQQV